MNVKDAGFVQQHTEKVVLGLAALLLVLCAVYLLIGNPFSIENYTIQELEERIVQDAERLQSNLQNESELEERLSGRAVAEYSVSFQELLEQSPVSLSSLASVGTPMPGEFDIEDVPPYHLPHPEPPPILAAVSGSAMLADEQAFDEADQRQALTELIDASSPPDFRYVSVAAEFDIQAYYELYTQAPPQGYEPMRENWLQSRRGLAGVYLQRQTQDQDTGQWEDTTTIGPLPTALGTMPGENDWESDEALAFIEQVLEMQPAVARSPFPPLAPGNLWFAPGDQTLNLAEADVSQVQAALEERQDYLERLATQATALEENPDDQLFVGRVERLSALVLEQEETIAEMLQVNRAELFGSEDVLARLSEEDADQGPNQPQIEAVAPQGADEEDALDGLDGLAAEGQEQGGIAELEEDGRIWAHDLTAQPGQVYRYRVLPAMLNPLFDRPLLADEQTDYADEVVIGPRDQELTGSPWSDPVQIDPRVDFFLVGGDSNAAQIEFWTFYAGRWRSGTFTIEPGQDIAAEMTVQTPAGEDEIEVDSGAQLVELQGQGSDLSMSYQPAGEGDQLERVVSEDQQATARHRYQVLSALAADLAQRAED